MDEFIARFKLQNKVALAAAEDDDASVPTILFVNSLPVKILTDIQRSLKPATLADATFYN